MNVIVLSSMESVILWRMGKEMGGSVFVLTAARTVVTSHIQRRKASRQSPFCPSNDYEQSRLRGPVPDGDAE